MVFRGGEWVGCDDGSTASEGVALKIAPRLYAKRAFDIIVATLGIVLFAPILLITSVAIKLDSRGPILIPETLSGYGKRTVRVYKFRFAAQCAKTQLNTQHLTRVGQIMSQTGIDGLPQLFNVLCGEMSIVGPRLYVSQPDLSESPHVALLESIKPGSDKLARPARYSGRPNSVSRMIYIMLRTIRSISTSRSSLRLYSPKNP